MISKDPSSTNANNQTGVDNLVGCRLRELRAKQGLSLRLLANLSGLNINTLSLMENGKTSPSVSTLQQIAFALDVPITAFFESEPVEKRVVFTPLAQRPQADFGNASMQNLGRDFIANSVQPFVVTLPPGQGSGDRKIVHTGFEFVYCLSGSVSYLVDEDEFSLNPGDSLVFEANLSHRWENKGPGAAQILLIFYPDNEREKSGEHHFSLEQNFKEKIMKIAVITDDGKSISQHFGRAPYYKVFTVAENKTVSSEMREKMGHNQFSGEEHEHHHGDSHGQDAASHGRHSQMANTISDCQTLICGGMGMGAYESMRRLNIQPIVTDLENIEEAVQAFLSGKLVDHTEKLH